MTNDLLHNLISQLSYDPHAPLVFSSGVFFVLFTGFLLIYYLLQRQYNLRFLFVVAFSYYFYYKSSGFYFFLLAVVTVSDFFIAQAMRRVGQQSGGKRKFLLILSLLVDLGLLGYFKYANFFGLVFSEVVGNNFQPWDIFLPVGISFFTFQSMSYTIDVYRGHIKPLNNLLDYAFYVSFFPQLVAGPIVRARDFVPQIRKPLVINQRMLAMGFYLIFIGLFKKAVISDYISVNFVDRIFDNPLRYTGVENLLGCLGYAMQLYCDFSGYSDMAIGIALLLGFKFPANFNAPFNAESVSDFWRRWHISLSSWIKDYVYIAWLGGSRCSRSRANFNLILAMTLCGLWHGASWNFVVWGVLAGLSLVVHKFFREKILRHDRDYRSRGVKRVFAVLSTFCFMMVIFLLFRNRDMNNVQIIATQIFTNFHPEVLGQWLLGYWAVALLVLVGYLTHYIPQRFETRVVARLSRASVLTYALLLTALIYLIIQVKTSDIQPFIYFQF